MKTVLTICTFLCVALATSCTKGITDWNIDGKNASDVPSYTLFTTGQKALVDAYNSTSVSVAPFRVLAQEWTENTYIQEAQYNFSAYNANAGWWQRLYGTSTPNGGTTVNPGVLSNLEAAKKKFALDISDPAVIRNNTIIADLLEVFTYHLLVGTYGDIPYSQAENNTIPYPKYDDAKTIWTDLLLRLDTCIAGLNEDAASLGAADQVYNGNMTAWKKFAATLKLKMALMLADTDFETASAKALEAVNTGIFSSNADDAVMHYDPSAVINSNPLWQGLVNSGRHDFVPSNLLVNTMSDWNDPRLALYFTKDPHGEYSGGVPGAGNGYGIFSDFSPAMQTPDYPGVLLSYAQTEFLLAEAIERGIAVGGTAASHYNNAIAASISYWGGTAADAIEYLLQPAVAYARAAGSWQQKLGYQKWITNYNMNWDSWTDIRRLGHPNLDVVNPPIGAKGQLPLRFTYPANESGSNAINWQDAVNKIPGGKDVVAAKLFWMK